MTFVEYTGEHAARDTGSIKCSFCGKLASHAFVYTKKRRACRRCHGAAERRWGRKTHLEGDKVT
jgi:formylmethanofuran dehydrogenase subunit E